MKKLLIFLLCLIFPLYGCGEQETPKETPPPKTPLEIAKESGVYYASYMQNFTAKTVCVTPANKANNAYSVAKFFTVLAVGQCKDLGLLSTEDEILQVLEISLPPAADQKWQEVTVDMLLSHTAGISGGLLDIDVDDVNAYGTDDYLNYVLSSPLSESQGFDYSYSDAAYYLLSLAVEKVSGKTLFDFLLPTLMQTLSFAEYSWSACPKGHTMGATGLYVRCEDVAKIGAVFANGGAWKGEQIVSESWVNTVLERGYSLSSLGDWYVKQGIFGQMVAFNPTTGESVAVMGCGDGIDLESALQITN